MAFHSAEWRRLARYAKASQFTAVKYPSRSRLVVFEAAQFAPPVWPSHFLTFDNCLFEEPPH